MALPRVLSVSTGNDLEMRAAPLLSSLRDKKLASLVAQTSPKERARALNSVQIENLAGEMSWRIATGPFSFAIGDTTGAWWSLKISRSASRLTLRVNEKSIELPASDDSEMRFYLLLDASVAELFCDDLRVLTSRIYRKPNGPLRVQISDSDLPALLTFEAWQLRPISPDRLTS